MIPLWAKVGVIMVAVGAVWSHGYNTRAKADRSAALVAENKDLKNNLAAIQKILVAENTRAQFSTIYVTDLREQINDYTQNTPALGSCVLDGDRTRRLSGIAQAASRGKRSPSSPAADRTRVRADATRRTGG